MDYLEERIRRVISKRKRLLKNKHLAETEGIDVSAVEKCWDLTEEIVHRYSALGLKYGSECLGISLEAMRLVWFDFLRTKHKSKRGMVIEIKKAIEQGAKSIEEIALKVGTSPAYLYQRYRKDVSLPCFENPSSRYCISERNLEIDELIEIGASLNEIGDEKKISRERVRQYILSTGQYKEWKKAREKNIQEREIGKFVLEKIASQIKEVARRRGTEEHALAYEKTEEYFSKVNSSHPYEQVFSFLKDYYETRERGEKISIVKLGEKHGLHFTKVSRILKVIGEKTLAIPRKKIREPVPEYKRQALEKLAEIPVPNHDIGYFLGLSEEVVSRYYRFFSENRNRRINADFHKPLKRFGSWNKAYLTYRLASQIYEAIDSEKLEGCGFSKQETLEVLSCDEKVFDYALKNRSEIEPVIIKVLRRSYPNKSVNKPYKNF